MKPSEVREQIGHQHLQLRILFVEVRAALDGAGDPRPAMLKLVHEVREHLDAEDRLLLPALREIDIWGALRAAEVAEEHAEQRARLSYLRELAQRGDRRDAVAVTRALVAELTADMNAEEHDLLD